MIIGKNSLKLDESTGCSVSAVNVNVAVICGSFCCTGFPDDVSARELADVKDTPACGRTCKEPMSCSI
jgi:hypothetical protein